PGAVSRLLLPTVLGVTVLVQGSAVRGGFQLDDFFHLFEGRALDPGTFLLRQESGHFIPLQKAASLALYELFGLHVVCFLLLVVATDVLNVALLYALVRRLTRTVPSAVTAAALWGWAPIHWQTIQWFSAYQFILAGTLTLALLLEIARGVAPGDRLGAWALVRM